jgi:hypothetical protein
MKTLLPIWLIFVIAGCISGCVWQKVEPNSEDSRALVSYFMPEGWVNTRLGTGDHYTREGGPKNPTVLGVIAHRRPSAVTMSFVMTNRAGKHDVQGHTKIEVKEYSKNGFTVWEGVYELKHAGRQAIWHDHMMLIDGYMVEVHLIAPKDEYAQYAHDLQTVVDSVRVLDSD